MRTKDWIFQKSTEASEAKGGFVSIVALSCITKCFEEVQLSVTLALPDGGEIFTSASDQRRPSLSSFYKDLSLYL